MILYGIYVTVIVLVLFGVAIFVHELGHFFSARMFGMVVEAFSLGFGPAIWKKKHRGTLYKICVFPIGGYVALPQMDPSEALPSAKPVQAGAAAADVADEKAAPKPPPLPYVAPWKKMIVAAAGAAGNMCLAVVIAWIVYLVGKPSMPSERSAIIGYVYTNSAAYTNGLRIGDEILAVNGVAVQNWSDVIQENARFESVVFTLRTPTGANTVAVPTEKNTLGFRMVDGLREVSLCKVMAVEPGSSAAGGGVRPNDIIVRFNGVDVFSVDHLVALVSARADMPTPLTVERGGQTLELTVSPQLDTALHRARIGIRFDPMAVDYDKVVHVLPSVQIKSHATSILRVVRALVTPKEARNTSQGLGGPLMIIYMIQDYVRKGIMIALSFMCFLNVNLAILNLLPIPVLDGGHIMFSLWELVTRRPIRPKFVLWIHQFFFILFIGAIILLSGRDVQRLYMLHRLSKTVSTQMAATNAVSNAVADEIANPAPIAETNEPAVLEGVTTEPVEP